MRPADVKRLMDAMRVADVQEVEVERRDEHGVVERVRLVRGGVPVRSAHVDAGAPAATPSAPAQSVAAPLAASATSTPAAPTAEPVAASRLVDVTAPIVGTFYAAPAPDVPNYVKPGDRVQVGAVLCIIEAMKLMNEIEADVAGTVVEVLVKNEDPVEYGQVLFRIDPS
ncbi:MAG: acetyl-CoA carboxylase biotin carboxyl carrier protein [Trueperaceae bacterium]|nr:MAG: acetyl-CoA carboxylase biotin carboxyl carrier protein [Trueperaceae bacterium]